MKKNLILFALSIWAAFVLVRCDDSTIVGGDLLNGEAIDLVFTDTTTIHTSTTLGKVVNSGRLSANTYMVGVLDDPIFGITTSDLYLGIQVIDEGPNYIGKEIDSMVMSLAYDSLGFYGNRSSLFDFELYRTTEIIKEDTTFSDEVLPIETTPIANEMNKVVSLTDSVFVIDPETDSLLIGIPHFRMRINPSFGINFFDLMRFVSDDASLLGVVPALYLNGVPNRSAMAGFSVGNSERLGDLNKFIVYMTDTLGVKSTYDFRYRVDRFSHFEHDYAGSPVSDFIDNEEIGDSLFFVQGMAGVNGVIDISNVLQYKDFLVNKAEIELTVAEDPEYQLDLYPPIELYGASFEGSEGRLVALQDLELISEFGLPVFGGELFEEEVDGIMLKKVKFNITNHVINFIDDPTIGGKIILSAFFESETPNRTVFYGAGHSRYPAKLNIAFTKS